MSSNQSFGGGKTGSSAGGSGDQGTRQPTDTSTLAPGTPKPQSGGPEQPGSQSGQQSEVTHSETSTSTSSTASESGKQ